MTAISRLRANVEADDADYGDWVRLVGAYLEIGQPAKAGPILDEMEQWLQDAATKAPDDEVAQAAEESVNRRAFLLVLRGSVAADCGEWENAISLFTRAAAVGDLGALRLSELIYRLVDHGDYEQALAMIDLDREYAPIRAAFWRGLVLHLQGDETGATRQWQRAVSIELDNKSARFLAEWTLSQYYLGDAKGEALSFITKLQQEARSATPLLLYLSGLGMFLRGRLTAVHQNLKFAVAQRKFSAEGKTLPRYLWVMARELFDPEQQAEFSAYFEDTKFSIPAAAESSPPAAIPDQESALSSQDQ